MQSANVTADIPADILLMENQFIEFAGANALETLKSLFIRLDVAALYDNDILCVCRIAADKEERKYEGKNDTPHLNSRYAICVRYLPKII
jgi:hypothetical protein